MLRSSVSPPPSSPSHSPTTITRLRIVANAGIALSLITPHHPLDSPPDRRAQGRTSYIFAPLKPLPSSPLLFLSSTTIHSTEAEVIRKSPHFILATSNLPKREVNTISSPIHRARQVFAPSRHCRSILPSSRSHPSPSDSSYSHPLSLHNSHPTFFTIPIPLSHHSQPPPTARTSTDT